MAAKNNPELETTEIEQIAEVVEVIKKGILQTVIEGKYLPLLVTGAVWDKTPEEIVNIRSDIGKFKDLLSTAYKMFDQELQTRRSINGKDHLKDVEYFRKPRESTKSTVDLAKELDM